MLSSGWLGSISCRLASTEPVSFCFDPLELHLQTPDLLEEFGFACGLFVMLTDVLLAEQAAAPLKQLPFPLGDFTTVQN
jgi:hypothetical protein